MRSSAEWGWSGSGWEEPELKLGCSGGGAQVGRDRRWVWGKGRLLSSGGTGSEGAQTVRRPDSAQGGRRRSSRAGREGRR